MCVTLNFTISKLIAIFIFILLFILNAFSLEVVSLHKKNNSQLLLLKNANSLVLSVKDVSTLLKSQNKWACQYTSLQITVGPLCGHVCIAAIMEGDSWCYHKGCLLIGISLGESWHNIIKIHNNVTWYWQNFEEYSPHSVLRRRSILLRVVLNQKEITQPNIVSSPTRILKFEVVMKGYEQIHTEQCWGYISTSHIPHRF